MGSVAVCAVIVVVVLEVGQRVNVDVIPIPVGGWALCADVSGFVMVILTTYPAPFLLFAS